MRKLRSRLGILLAILVMLSTMTTLVISYQMRNGMRVDRQMMRWIAFGVTMKDVLLLVVAMAVLILAIILITRDTTNPIRTLSNAANEIAKGNYDVQVSLRRDRVAEYGELQRNFNAMAQQLQKNEYLHKDFIASVSHELKTPLAIIEGYAHLLQEEHLTQQQRREYADAIEKESMRLTDMTQNMLRLSRMDAGQQSLQKTSYRLDEQLRRCLILLQPKWDARNITPEIEAAPVCLLADETLMQQVWLNLLDNAIKFSDEGKTIWVRVHLTACDQVVVEICDEGIGMDEQTQARMFERFFQADPSHGQRGSGLGLSLVRRIVQLHDGTINVHSIPGHGTRICIMLPHAGSCLDAY